MADALRVRSAVPGIAWPALPSVAGARLLALMQQLDESQWLPPEELAARQAAQLDALLAHAYETVPFYRERWGRRPRAGELHSLPLLARRDLQDHFGALRSSAPPPSHGTVYETATSGSMGAPVRVLKTGLTDLWWNAITLRDHLWHGRDLSGRLAVIATHSPPGRLADWGPATRELFHTGPAAVFEEERERDEQVRWLEAERPDVLVTHASNALVLARRCLELGVRLRLREVRTYGDMLDPAAHAACAEAWGAKVVDVYSVAEAGYLALQCPQQRHYHVQSETVIVELLDDAGRACRPGEIGRVAITLLHGFALPLVRYVIGDAAQAGGPCACGRGLPVLERIVGRTRNLLRTPGGRTYWPYLGSIELASIAPVRNHQFVQKALDLVELRLVTDARLTPEQEDRVRTFFAGHLPEDVRLELRYVERFPGSRPGEKYEYFVSELPE